MTPNVTLVLDPIPPPALARRVRPRTEPVRIALVGCGAMAEQNLLPVLAGHERIRVEALVDRDRSRAQAMASAYGMATVLSDIAELPVDRLDGVILATPPACHAPQALDLLGRGLHVFVEKPMALKASDAGAMVAAAEDAGVVLSVGLYRRLLPSTRLLRALIDSGIVGRALAVDIEEGGEYGWQLATLANLTPTLGGGGVLIDIGSHLIDQLQFVLPGRADVAGYSDNSKGGVETDAILELCLQSGGGVLPCRIELSRTRKLRNTIRVRCERGTLELARGEFARVAVRPDDVTTRDPLSGVRVADLTAQWGDEAPPNGYQTFRAEIDDWIDAMSDGREPVLSGRSTLPTVKLIEDAYRSRRPLPEPWRSEGMDVRRPRRGTKKRRVLVTGASGFIGCRTAEILSLRDGWDVRALVRDPSHAARLACLPVEMVAGDICSPDSVMRALDGCDAVVHCAVGTSWKRKEVARVTVDGTRHVAEAARRAGIARFVHLSSMAVYESRGALVLDEGARLVGAAGDDYGSDKRQAEDAVIREIGAGLPAVILRPTRVYGPFGRTFTIRPLQHLSRNRLVLAGPVDAPSNMVYVDNLVQAIACALDAEASVVGESFNVSDPDQLSWREFYEFFARCLETELKLDPGRTRTDRGSLTDRAAQGWFARVGNGIGEIVSSTEFRGFGRKCLETDPIGRIPRWAWDRFPALRHRIQKLVRMEDAVIYRPAATAPEEADMVFYAEQGLVSSDKATQMLGFEPAVQRARAMALTFDWLKHSRYVEMAGGGSR